MYIILIIVLTSKRLIQTMFDRKQSKQTKTTKYNKNYLVSAKDIPKDKHYANSFNQQQYLSPISVKSPKHKSKFKQSTKGEKQKIGLSSVNTKIKRKKNNKSELNGTIIVNQNIEVKKENKSNIKIMHKSEDKHFGQTEKKFKKMKNEQNEIHSKKTLNGFSGLKIKEKSLKNEIILPRQQQEYLFLGDQFYLINNYCPTKRLLNTYRDALTNKDNIQGKFIAQDKNDSLGKKKIEFKRNIFTATRQHIQFKNKIKKIIIIQRWWRKQKKQLTNLNLQQSNPQFKQFSQDNISWSNHISEIEQNNASSKQTILNHTLKIDKSFGKEILNQNKHLRTKVNIISEIISFNSEEIIDAPKKIDLKKPNSPQKMMEQYKIPQISQYENFQNEEIFVNFNKFNISQANQDFCDSPDSDDQSQNLTNSPIKSQEQILNLQDMNYSSVVSSNAANLLHEFQEATKIRQQIQFRLLLQKGQIKLSQTAHNRIGINTSVISIHNFLVKFFHFYIQNHKQQFLSLINMPFGHSVTSRLQHLRGKKLPSEPQQDQQGILYGLQYIIDDKKYENFYKQIMKFQLNINNSFLKANHQIQIIHNKAIIDIFNQELNKYRPYCQIRGVPYPWNHSYKALTFYFVTEENILEVFEKVQLKILQEASLICGIHLNSTNNFTETQGNEPFDVGKFMINYQTNTHGLVLQHNEAKQIKLIRQQLKQQQIFEYDSQVQTLLMLEISNLVFQQFLAENAMQIHTLFNRKRLIF